MIPPIMGDWKIYVSWVTTSLLILPMAMCTVNLRLPSIFDKNSLQIHLVVRYEQDKVAKLPGSWSTTSNRIDRKSSMRKKTKTRFSHCNCQNICRQLSDYVIPSQKNKVFSLHCVFRNTSHNVVTMLCKCACRKWMKEWGHKEVYRKIGHNKTEHWREAGVLKT